MINDPIDTKLKNYIFELGARFVYKKLISEARIKDVKQIKNEIEKDWGPKIP